MTRAGLTGGPPARVEELFPFALAVVMEPMKWIAPFMLILFVVMIVTLLFQVGFLFTGHPLIPTLNKLNPINGIQRLFSIRSVMLAMVNFGKLLLVGLVAYMTMSGRADAIVHLFMFPLHEGFALGASLMFELTMWMGAALLILALLDFAWQRYRHEKDLRMTKEEVKDELRSMEGDPQLKRRRKEVQLRLAMQRLRRDVPTADVIVTNPTHVAVAIRYDAETMPAPKVIAKGADLVAMRIRQIAIEFGVPIVQRPPMARAMYESVEVGEQIPERLYQAMAEILAFVYELEGKSPARRKMVGSGT
jgi:flagellar biosynthetic protein FlhB